MDKSKKTQGGRAPVLLAVLVLLCSLAAPAAAQTGRRIEIGLSGITEWNFNNPYGNEFSIFSGLLARVDLPGKKSVGMSFGVAFMGGLIPGGTVNVLLCSPEPRIIRPYAFIGLAYINSFLPVLETGAGLKIDFSRSFGIDAGVRYWPGPSSLIVTAGVSIGL